MVASWLEHPPREWEVLGSIPGCDTPKSLKLVEVASSLALRIMGIAIRLASHCQDNGLVNPFPNKPWFSCVCSTSLLKKLWEKEKLLVEMLVTSNFSFSQNFSQPFGELSAISIKFEIVICNSFSLEQSKICCLGLS